MIKYDLNKIQKLVQSELKIFLNVELDTESSDELAYKVRVMQGKRKLAFFRDHDINIAVNGALLKAMNRNLPIQKDEANNEKLDTKTK